MAVHILRKAQLALETTWDTAVVATVKLMALNDGAVDFHNEVYRPDFLGSIGPSNVVDQVATDWSASLSGACTYEDLPYWFDAMFGIDAVPTGSGPYVYGPYVGPTAAIPTAPRIVTLEYGTATGSYKASGGLATELSINIEQGQPWMYDVSLIGGTLAVVTLASLSDRTVTLVNTAVTDVFVDAHGGTVGSTSVKGSVINADLTFSNERHMKRFVGDKIPSNWGEGKFDFTLDLVMEFNATSKAYLDAILTAQVSKLVRLKATTGATRIVQIDLAGAIQGDVSLWDDRDGNSTAAFSLFGHYDGTNSMWMSTSITNSVTSLP